MVQSSADTVPEFHKYVNMTADELDSFLKSDQSSQAGWPADDGSGESVGQHSGHKIVDILRRNPDKDPSKYTDEDKAHMRKVVAYCKRHLAQEGHMKDTKTPEELEKTKSTISLKNWGHDPLKGMKGSSGGKPASKKADKPASKKADKPTSKKAEKEDEPKPESKSDKPASKKAADKPASKKAEKPASKKEDGAATKKKEAEAEVGEKREAPAKAETSEKPASKKAKTEKKPPSEGSRKPPSRGAKEKK